MLEDVKTHGFPSLKGRSVLKKRNNLLMAAALPSSTLFCSQSARGKRFAEQHKEQRRNEDSEG